MNPGTILIVSVSNDLHALHIRNELRTQYGLNCAIVESDQVRGLSWSNNSPKRLSALLGSDGEIVDIHGVQVIWWRRFKRAQRIPEFITDPAEIDLINNDARESLLGLLSTEFKGTRSPVFPNP